MDIPGLDPDRNSLQMDIFPTSLVDQVIVLKSATADQPADFTGGIVDIVTKDIPSTKLRSFSFSTSYNNLMSLRDDFLKSEGSSTDWLGFDDGLRDLPVDRKIVTPRPTSGDPVLGDITNSFGKVLGSSLDNSLTDFRINYSEGNQYDIGRKRLGFIAALSYSQNYEHYENYETNFFIKNTDKSVNELRPSELTFGPQSSHSILASGIFGLSLKGETSKYKFQALRLQNGESSAASYQSESLIDSANEQKKDVVEYNERSVTNFLLSGSHFLADGKFNVDWKLSPTFNINRDKDIRYTPYRFDEGSYSIQPSETGEPRRLWRDLEEFSYVGKLDLKYESSFNDNPLILKAGSFFTYKERDYSISNFALRFRGRVADAETGDPDLLLQDYNIWDAETGFGAYYINDTGDINEFVSDQMVLANYFSAELNLTEKLRTVFGVRHEIYTQRYTGIDQNDVLFSDQEIIDNMDIYPSLNLIYGINENTNLRGSYSKTVARPSFKEASNVTIFDPVLNIVFLGNLDLKPTYIDNFDLRYEVFPGNGEIIAASVFYKNFTDPIEIVTYSDAATDNFQPRNVGEATVYGLEIEVRKSLTDRLSARFNTSVIEAQQDFDRSPSGEYDSKLLNLRNGEEMKEYRPLQGQSPFLVNAGLEYQDESFSANLAFNTQGRTLEVVGIGASPDIYTMPFNSLNLNLEKKLGEKDNKTLTLRVRNLLNDSQDSQFISFGAQEDYFFTRRAQGVSVSLGFRYKL
jgi:outer membrane receptor protein involved in Fe transport